MNDSESSNASDQASESSSDEPVPSPVKESNLVSEGSLTAEGKKAVAGWINEGLGLSEVQKKLSEEHGLTLTYMETRFLVDDLELALQDPVEPVPEVPEGGSGEEVASGQDNENAEAGSASDSPSEDGGEVTVEVDKVVRPGAVVSGTATMPDGVSMQWHLDQMGRLGVNPPEGYQPSEENVAAFQKQLQVALREAGF